MLYIYLYIIIYKIIILIISIFISITNPTKYISFPLYATTLIKFSFILSLLHLLLFFYSKAEYTITLNYYKFYQTYNSQN